MSWLAPNTKSVNHIVFYLPEKGPGLSNIIWWLKVSSSMGSSLRNHPSCKLFQIFCLLTRQEPCKIMECNLWKYSSALSQHKKLHEWKQVMHKRQATLNYGSLYRHNALPFLFCSEVVDVIVHAINALPYCEQSGWQMVTEGTESYEFSGFYFHAQTTAMAFFQAAQKYKHTWKQIPESSGRLWSDIMHWSIIGSSEYSN